MKIDSAFLRSRVGRRIFFLFVVCSLLPILALAVVSYRSVTRELRTQSEERLHQLSKTQAMAILERLTLLSGELELAVSQLIDKGDLPGQVVPESPDDLTAPRFSGFALATGAGEIESQSGTMPELPVLDEADLEHLAGGRTVLAVSGSSQSEARMLLGWTIEPGKPEAGLLWGEIDSPYLWWGPGRDNILPAGMELCIFYPPKRQMVYCSFETPAQLPSTAAHQIGAEPRGFISWRQEDTDYLARYRLLPLHGFSHPGLTVILSESTAKMIDPLKDFKRTFPLILLTTLWVVLLLATSQIRRSLGPLEKLQEGTHRIAGREFDTRVEIDSGDEFEQLADSFNAMAGDLGRQFNALTTMNEIVQAVLSALDTETIVGTTLANVNKIVPCAHVSLTLLDVESSLEGRTFVQGVGVQVGADPIATDLSSEEVSDLRERSDYRVLTLDADCPTYLQELRARGDRSALVLPILLKGQLAAILAAGISKPTQLAPDTLEQARQLADQVAVALSNARLIEELDRLSWGTLTALARAIDAKSHWTMGHSERVTAMALRIGRAMDLSEEELGVLHQGALLHDIGKIGITSKMLDKPSRLSEAEMEVVRGHVEMGARILEPVPALANAVPIVLQHHEQYDGKGYPHGLIGEEIHLGARILMVADYYDAMRSARPYRPPGGRKEVVDSIAREAGKKFDPQVVGIFLQLIRDEEEAGEDKKDRAAWSGS
ncbi:MAG: HD domain-containing protein [Acidobacteria bacterium]|nr:MAG: HD domain-containing protein [Acidobacteriota bacterium]